MAYLTIESTNPDLSYLIAKNPLTIQESGKPFEREVRKGRVYGWFPKPDNSQFRLLFVDSEIESSFSSRDGEWEYLDTTRYSHPYAPIAIITASLTMAANKPDPRDTPNFLSSVETVIRCPHNIVARFKQMPGFGLEAEQVSTYRDYKVKVTAPTVSEALNRIQALCLIATLADDDFYIPLPKPALQKYVNVLNRAKAPYYLRHLFSSRAITNPSVFAELAPQLNSDSITLQYGNTQVQRFNAIKEYLKEGDDLVDIGSGEMYHALKLAKNYVNVLCIDADENVVSSNANKVKRKQIENVVPLHQLVNAEWVKENSGLIVGTDVLLSEVLEHMSIKEAGSLLKALVEAEPRQIVVTVPNGAFNTHWGIEVGERHEDHQWEPTFEEWTQFLKNNLSKDVYVKTDPIGDSVGDASVSIRTIIKPAKPQASEPAAINNMLTGVNA